MSQETEDLLSSIMKENGYIAGKVLQDDSIAVVLPLMFSTAIAMNVDRCGWSKRFCFEDRSKALEEFAKLKTDDDEPSGWIARL